MRRTVLLLVLIIASAPAYGQSSSGATSSVNISNPASTDSKNRLITPPTVVAPGLAAAGMETCLGSATGGLSLMGIGFSFGKTTTDEGCSIRLAARQLHAFGFPKAAMALMCQDTRVAEAMAAAGQSCLSFAAETAPRRRQRAEVGGSIVPTGAPKRSRNAIVVTWKNPDLAPADDREETIVTSGLSDAQQRWFDRASGAY
jgi:hypothetical protein